MFLRNSRRSNTRLGLSQSRKTSRGSDVAFRLHIEQLETRTVLSASATAVLDPVCGLLNVYGTPRDDEFEVTIGEDSVVDVYGSVKAEVHQFQKEISSGGLLDFKIIDGRTGTLISQRKFPGTFVWYDKWGFYNGDERALENEDKEFIKRKRESPNPPPQDLFIEFTKPIFDQVTAFVGEFYRNY